MVSHPVRAERWLNAAVFGEFGVGKTHLVATAMDVETMNDVLFIDIESGDLTLQERPTLDLIPIREYKKIQKIYEWLKAHANLRTLENKCIDIIKKLETKSELNESEAKILEAARTKLTETVDNMIRHQARLIDPEKDPRNGELRRFKTVIIDSFTELQKLNMYMLMGIDIGKARLDEELAKPEWDEWGQTTNMTRLLVRTLRDMPYHVLLVCSEKIVEDKNKRATIVLNLPKALAAEVPGFLDMVGYYAMKTDANGNKARILFLQPGSGYQAKSRFPNSPAFLVNPTMQDIMKLVKSGG
jgi:hypothetical protein